jgi:uncharacterized membrane protein (UPF0136 family)
MHIYYREKSKGWLLHENRGFVVGRIVFFGTQLLARAQTQGLEAALFSSGVEYGLGAVRVGSKLLHATLGSRAA